MPIIVRITTRPPRLRTASATANSTPENTSCWVTSIGTATTNTSSKPPNNHSAQVASMGSGDPERRLAAVIR